MHAYEYRMDAVVEPDGFLRGYAFAHSQLIALPTSVATGEAFVQKSSGFRREVPSRMSSVSDCLELRSS